MEGPRQVHLFEGDPLRLEATGLQPGEVMYLQSLGCEEVDPQLGTRAFAVPEHAVHSVVTAWPHCEAEGPLTKVFPASTSKDVPTGDYL